MEKGKLLNSHELTQNNPKNDEAKNHIDHTVIQVGSPSRMAYGVPYQRLYVSKHICQDCKKLFYAYNYFEDEVLKDVKLRDSGVEHG